MDFAGSCRKRRPKRQAQGASGPFYRTHFTRLRFLSYAMLIYFRVSFRSMKKADALSKTVSISLAMPLPITLIISHALSAKTHDNRREMILIFIAAIYIDAMPTRRPSAVKRHAAKLKYIDIISA